MKSIIEQAIHLETTAESTYREAARRTSDASAAKILDSLADEEARHAKILRGMTKLEHLEDAHLLEHARSWIRGVVEGGRQAISSDAELPAVLRRAMSIERMTESFYREHAAASLDAATANLFTILADIENKHFLLVSSWVDYFNRPNEWIESAEFGVRDEY